MNYLLLTLGHGSSAVFVDTEANKAIGYEQERISALKSDSQFPTDAINEICKNVPFDKMRGCTVLISHWFDFVADKNAFPNKYAPDNNIQWLLQTLEPSTVKMVNENFTHHDAHAFSGYSFFKYHLNDNQKSNEPLHVVVMDGFGNDREVISVYKTDMTCTAQPSLIHRVYGYNNSIGLMYQYATSFVGMKENQDEYKFLGYEAFVDKKYSAEEIKKLDITVAYMTDAIMKGFDNDVKRPVISNQETLISIDGLKQCSKYWSKIYADALKGIGREDFTDFDSRVAVAYLIQQTTENVMKAIISKFDIKNLIVVGGSFFNVKLNNAALTSIPGLFCAMPLAGDQGAAIGMLEAEGVQFPFKTLCIGKRSFYNADKMISQHHLHNDIVYTKTTDETELYKALDAMVQDIANGKMVDMIWNNVEFGPRALCSTTTLFCPTGKNAKKNNRMNGRNEVMPFAPVCTRKNALKLFGPEVDRVVGSDSFMICTHDYVGQPYSDHYAGVMHKKTMVEDTYTGRPQIVDEGSYMAYVLNGVEEYTGYKCLVNTSFNVHGQPIVFTLMQILNNFEYQYKECKKNNEDTPKLYIFDVE